MIKLYKIKTIAILNIVFALLIQGCSSKYSSYNPWSVNKDAISNRRSPPENPNAPQEQQQDNQDSNQNTRQDFSQSNQAYQRYMSNQPITLKEFDQQKRYPHLNVPKLNLAMDNSASKPIEVSSTSNLKEVIDHNKKQQTKKTSSKTSEKHTKKSTNKIEKKANAINNNAKKVDTASVTTKSNATVPTTVKAPQVTTSNIPTGQPNDISIKNNTIVPTAAKAPQVTTSNIPTGQTSDIASKNNAIVPTAEKAPQVPTSSIPTGQPNDIAIKNNAIVPTAVKAPQVPTSPVTTGSSAPAPIQDTKLEIDKMSQSDIENHLKSKFKNNSAKEFIDKIENEFSLGVDKIEDEFSSNKTKKSNTSTNVSSNTSPNTGSMPTTPAPAVSKILTTNSRTKLDKINSLMLECYFNIKNKVIYKIYSNE